MMKKMFWALLTCSALTACAQPMTKSQDNFARMPAPPAVQDAAAVSQGASDDIGGYMQMSTHGPAPIVEASAAPTR